MAWQRILTGVTLVAFVSALVPGCSGPKGAPVAGSAPTSAVVPGSGSPSASPPASGVGTAASGAAQRSPAPAGKCSIFPANNVWHADVSHLPVRPDSAKLVAGIGRTEPVHADFGSGLWEGGPIGIPITTVPPGQPGVKVSFQYASESDRGPYPIPKSPAIEGGTNAKGDRHVILLDPATCRDYELYAAKPRSDGSWSAGSGAIFDLRGNALRPAGWTSADAAGLSILAGLVRYDEVAAGHIDHAIRVTVPNSRDAYVWPARHAASDSDSASLPPMGLRLRLKSTVDISKLPTQARIVAEAMKRYGVIVADNGSPWYLSGVPDPHWNNDALHALGNLDGNDFEAVDTSSLMASPNSAAVKG